MSYELAINTEKNIDDFINDNIDNLFSKNNYIFCQYIFHRFYSYGNFENEKIKNIISELNTIKYSINTDKVKLFYDRFTKIKLELIELEIISKIQEIEINKILLFHYGYYANILNDNIDIIGLVIWFLILKKNKSFTIDQFIDHLFEVYANKNDLNFDFNFKNRIYLIYPNDTDFSKKIAENKVNIQDILLKL